MKTSSIKCTLVLALLFVTIYTVIVGHLFPSTLRMMEANAWIRDWALQFFRWPYVGALIMSLCFCCVMLFAAGLIWGISKMNERLSRLSRWMPLTVILPVILAYNYPPTASYVWGEYSIMDEAMKQKEQLYTYHLLAESKQWDELMCTIMADDSRNSDIGVKYMLLAESAQGTLIDNLFTYPINSTEQFLYRGLSNETSCLLNMHFYDNMQVWDEAFHQAQEYAMCQQDFCFLSVKEMVEYSIAEAEWKVAEKLLYVLDQALFYHDFVAESRNRIAEGKKQRPCNDASLRNGNFVTGFSLQNEMVHMYQDQVGDTIKSQEYAMACMLLRKKLAQVRQGIDILPRYRNMKFHQLPLPIQQAVTILDSNGQALRNEPSGTYAYYLYNIRIPEVEQRYGISYTH